MPGPEYRFSAHGFALIRQVRIPYEQPMPAFARCELSPGGGHASARADALGVPGDFSIESGVVECHGIDSGDSTWETHVNTDVRGCVIRDALKIDRLSASLRSRQPMGDGDASFSLPSLSVEGIRLGGDELRVELDSRFRDLGTYRSFIERIRADRELRTQMNLGKAESNGRLSFSPVRQIRSTFGRLQTDGNKITYPGFGTLRLFEVVLSRDKIELTSLNAQIEGPGRPAGFIIGQGSINGIVLGREPERVRQDGSSSNHDQPGMMEEEQLTRILQELAVWSSSHPRRDEPFLFFMGRSFTPLEFFREVEDQTEFGRSFLHFLNQQSERSGERPWHAIARAVEANKSS